MSNSVVAYNSLPYFYDVIDTLLPVGVIPLGVAEDGLQVMFNTLDDECRNIAVIGPSISSVTVLKVAIEYIHGFCKDSIVFSVFSSIVEEFRIQKSKNFAGVYDFEHENKNEMFKSVSEYIREGKSRPRLIIFVESADLVDGRSLSYFRDILINGHKANISVIATISPNSKLAKYFDVQLFSIDKYGWFECRNEDDRFKFYAPVTNI